LHQKHKNAPGEVNFHHPAGRPQQLKIPRVSTGRKIILFGGFFTGSSYPQGRKFRFDRRKNRMAKKCDAIANAHCKGF
jgi:hypothetical protein